MDGRREGKEVGGSKRRKRKRERHNYIFKEQAHIPRPLPSSASVGLQCRQSNKKH